MEIDWLSPPGACSRRSRSSPCIDRRQRQVADAVLFDLQIDLEAQVQRAVNQIITWTTAEITFARQGFEQDARKTCESWAMERMDMNKAQAELRADFVQLQAVFDQQMTALQTLKDGVCTLTRQSALAEPPLASASLQEADSQPMHDAHVLEELRVVRSQLQRHEEHIQSVEENLVTAKASLSSDVQEARAELSEQLSTRVCVSAMRKVCTAMQRGVDEACSQNQVVIAELDMSLKSVAAANLEQARITQMHEDWLNDLDTVRERERHAPNWHSFVFGSPQEREMAVLINHIMV